MIVVGKNLSTLMTQHKMVDHEGCFDNTCIKLSLGNTYIQLVPSNDTKQLVYGEAIPDQCIKKLPTPHDGLLLPSKSSILACSAEQIYMPVGYMGLLQTKGSLARLFVSLHFSDGQIDSGFKGHITFELFNGSDFDILIPKKAPVGNLYVFKTSTKVLEPYSGHYAGKDIPTIQQPID